MENGKCCSEVEAKRKPRVFCGAEIPCVYVYIPRACVYIPCFVRGSLRGLLTGGLLYKQKKRNRLFLCFLLEFTL